MENRETYLPATNPPADSSLGSVVDTLEDELRRTPGDDVERAVLLRAVIALATRMTRHLDVLRAVDFTRLDDDAFLIELTKNLVFPELVGHSKKTALRRMEGQAKLLEFLREHGGALSQKEVADLLGIGEDAVRKRRTGGKLLALRLGRELIYPGFQFTDHGVLPHLDEVIAAIPANDPIAHIRFLISPNPAFGMSPAEALRKGEPLEPILQKARQVGEQIAW